MWTALAFIVSIVDIASHLNLRQPCAGVPCAVAAAVPASESNPFGGSIGQLKMNQFVVSLLDKFRYNFFFLNLDPYLTVFKNYAEIHSRPQITKSSIKTSLLCGPEYRVYPLKKWFRSKSCSCDFRRF